MGIVPIFSSFSPKGGGSRLYRPIIEVQDTSCRGFGGCPPIFFYLPQEWGARGVETL